jgi:sensor histidine kinase YesM
LEQTDEHIGIRNTLTRLKMRYGDGFSAELYNGPGGGAHVRLRLPLKTQ